MSPDTYYEVLAKIYNSPPESDKLLIETWENRYISYLQARASRGSNYIIEGLILVHKLWWERFGTLPERGWMGNPNTCSYHLINKDCGKCPFIIKGITKIVNDHFWPKSLGGPEDPNNLLGLCTHHNEAKSSSVENFDFHNEPKWLENRLRNISILLSTKS
tara:strand:- start:85 stop:567 length:483 start_codon:yes stop_codon:yes gene_type:complete